MTKATVTPYARNFNDTLPFSSTCVKMLLAASTALSWTVPGEATQKYRAKFRASSTAEIWVGYNVTATVPTSNTATNVPYIEFLPLDECRYVNGGDVLSFISLTTPSIGVSLLQVEDIS
jgi:hypothetical protein